MNCSDFEQRMQQRIDEGLSLVNDDLLAAHARWCDQCRVQMVLWQQIDSVLLEDQSIPKAMPHRSGERRDATWAIMIAVAAVLLLAFFAAQPSDDVATPTAFRPPEAGDEYVVVDPVLWWRNVQDQDWIGQTMPAVHSVRDGVAPLGRSLLQAVAILATGRGESTS